MARVITLTTDFGVTDWYVAAMKGVILDIHPDATIADISHAIPAQDVRQGAFVLGMAYKYFPEGTIHVAVVDPGVGTDRRPIAVEGLGHYFTGPDNGLLTYIFAEARERGSTCRAVDLTKNQFWLPTVSSTFHGRDIFAPVAAHLALGVPLEELGETVESIVEFPIPSPTSTADGSVEGEVIYVDGFGNLVTNIRAEDLTTRDIAVTVASRTIRGVSPSYQEGEALMSIIGSSGRLEIAEKNGSATTTLHCGVGTKVVVRG